MGFVVGFLLGAVLGVGLIVGFARYQNIRSRRRTDLVLFFFFLFFIPFIEDVILSLYNVGFDFMLIVSGISNCSFCEDDSSRF